MFDQGSRGAALASWLTVLSLFAGCHDEAADRPAPIPPNPPASSADQAASATASEVHAAKGVPERQALTEAGYFGEKESARAWKENHETCPGALDGSEMIGRTMAEWHLDPWLDGQPRRLADLRGRVVVVRFWMAPGCPFCEKTMPALQELSEELTGKPVTFVGAFHSKPVTDHTTLELPAEVAKKWGVEFPIALDPDWKTLRSWWYGDGAHRHASSVTFVIGKDGKLVFVHPGPVFHPTDDPDEAKANADYLAVRAAIMNALDDER